jgi:acetylornithine deacetylase/succinyl-diaminopimelate desuccinylase-like protein
VRLQPVENGRCNIFASFIADDKYPTIIVNGHIDTVEPMDGWNGREYAPRVAGNKLYGLGAADQKAGVAVALSVFRELYGRAKANITILLCVDEEYISKGAFRAMERIPKADLCLITEPSGENLGIAARGRLVIKLDIKGKSAHGARPHLGINAIDEAGKIVNELGKIRTRKDPFMKSGSLCALKIESGVESLSVPEYCKILVDRHMINAETRESVLNEFRNAVKASGTRAKVAVSVAPRETPYLEAYHTDIKQTLAAKFCRAYKKFYGKTPVLYCNESVGDYNVFGQRIPTIIYGPKGGNWHAANEFVYIDSIIRCRKLYIEFLKNLK